MSTRDHKYSVAFSEEDQEWVATIPSCASLSFLAPTPLEALYGLMRLIANPETLRALAEAKGRVDEAVEVEL